MLADIRHGLRLDNAGCVFHGQPPVPHSNAWGTGNPILQMKLLRF